MEKDLALSAEEYIQGMLNPDHLNGLFLVEYGLDEFRARAALRALKYNVSYEGRELLSADVVRAGGHPLRAASRARVRDSPCQRPTASRRRPPWARRAR